MREETRYEKICWEVNSMLSLGFSDLDISFIDASRLRLFTYYENTPHGLERNVRIFVLLKKWGYRSEGLDCVVKAMEEERNQDN